MKKSFLMLGIAVLAAFVSCKKETPAPDVLELLSTPETVITKDGTDTPLTVTFKATKAWTASVDADFATITPKSGDPADECKVKINVAANETTADRSFTVTLKSEGVTPVTVTFKQESQFHLNIDPVEFSVTKAGGDFTVNVDANVEFTVTDYSDGSFSWQHAVPANDGKSYKVTIDANTGYDPRTSYVKFKTSEIQVPATDPETGEPTGEMEDLTIRVYFYQEGLLSQVWRKEFTWDLYNEGHRYSTALAGDYLLVSTGLGVKAYNKANGEFVADLEFPTPTGITNDSVGNLVFSVGGGYEAGSDPLTVYAVKASEFGGSSVIPTKVLEYNNVGSWYGYGMDNVRVSGDIFNEAVVTVVTAAGYNFGSYAVAFQIENGAPVDGGRGYTDYVTLPCDAALWSSGAAVVFPLGSKMTDGIYYNGYESAIDGAVTNPVYDVRYNPGTWSMSDWTSVIETGSSWAEGYNCMDIIDWNGHKYLGFIGMSYFAYADWDYDGTVDGYMPSYLWLANIDNPAAPVVVSKIEYYADPANFCYGSTTDICLELEGDDLVAYIWDSSASCYAKVKYPKL